MRCKEFDEFLESGTQGSSAASEHLKHCPACAEAAADWKLLRSGFATLAAEQVPEPSIGFTERLMRRLANSSDQGLRGQEFLERAGRRVLYATLLVTLMALLGLLLPSSGPLRGPSHPTMLFAQPDMASDFQEPILGAASFDQAGQPDGVSSSPRTPRGGAAQK